MDTSFSFFDESTDKFDIDLGNDGKGLYVMMVGGKPRAWSIRDYAKEDISIPIVNKDHPAPLPLQEFAENLGFNNGNIVFLPFPK